MTHFEITTVLKTLLRRELFVDLFGLGTSFYARTRLASKVIAACAGSISEEVNEAFLVIQRKDRRPS